MHNTHIIEHPGGPKIILKYAGKDATDEFDPIHPPDTLDKYLDKSHHLGDVDMDTVAKEQADEDPDEEARQERIKHKPILEQCYNLMDFEAVARRVLKKQAWAYYSSGADDEIVSHATQLLPLPCICSFDVHRLCARTIRPITRYGFGRGSLWM